VSVDEKRSFRKLMTKNSKSMVKRERYCVVLASRSQRRNENQSEENHCDEHSDQPEGQRPAKRDNLWDVRRHLLFHVLCAWCQKRLSTKFKTLKSYDGIRPTLNVQRVHKTNMTRFGSHHHGMRSLP